MCFICALGPWVSKEGAQDVPRKCAGMFGGMSEAVGVVQKVGTKSLVYCFSPALTLVIKMITCNFFLFWEINFLKITITIASINP